MGFRFLFIKHVSWTRLFIRSLPSKIAGFYEIINVIFYYCNYRVLVFTAATWTCLSYFVCSVPVLSAFIDSSSSQLCQMFEAEIFTFRPSLLMGMLYQLTRLQLILYNSFSPHTSSFMDSYYIECSLVN